MEATKAMHVWTADSEEWVVAESATDACAVLLRLHWMQSIYVSRRCGLGYAPRSLVGAPGRQDPEVGRGMPGDAQEG